MQEQLFEGRYRLLAELSSTRSSVTYRAHDQANRKVVEIQVYGRPINSLDGNLSSYQIDNVELFLNNAQQLKRLNERTPGNYFQPVLEFGMSRATQQAYIVLQHIEGAITLEEILSRLSGVTAQPGNLMGNDNLENRVREVMNYIWVLEQSAFALDFAYEQAMSHNNFTPKAILIAEPGAPGVAGSVWLADFDLSSSNPNLNTRLSQSLPIYASPEQRQGLAAERSSDVYAFAAVAYELIFGRPPTLPTNFQPEAVIVDTVKLFPKVNGTLASVLGKALHYTPRMRYQTALEFVSELKKALDTWQRDWASYRRAYQARGQQDYQLYKEARLGLYTLDRHNREAWHVAELQEELGKEMASLPSSNFAYHNDVLTVPPPEIRVAGMSSNGTTKASIAGEVFEYRSEDFASHSDAGTSRWLTQAIVPVNQIQALQAVGKFRPNLPTTMQLEAEAHDASFRRNGLWIALVPLLLFLVAATIIALLVTGGDNQATATSVAVVPPVTANVVTTAVVLVTTQAAPLATTPVAIILPTATIAAPTATTVPQSTATPAPTTTVALPTATAAPPPPTSTPLPPSTPVALPPAKTYGDYYNEGLAFLEQGNFGAAKDPLIKALDLKPDGVEALRGRNYADAGIALGDGKLEEAIGLLEVVYKEDSNYLKVQELLQTALIGYANNLAATNPGEAKNRYNQAAALAGPRQQEALDKATAIP